MFVAAHRTRLPRAKTRDDRDHILAFAPDPAVRRWIEHETFAERVSVEFVDTLADLVTPPWPQFVILAADALSSADVEVLEGIRAAGWQGSVIAVGDPSPHAQHALDIDIVLPRTMPCELLRNAINETRAATPAR